MVYKQLPIMLWDGDFIAFITRHTSYGNSLIHCC